MAEILLSEAEKTFIFDGVEDNFRSDGRSRLDYRPIEVETDVVTHASGSARLRMANTDILVGVKTEIDAPIEGKPGDGKLEFFVDCSANATPEFEGRGGEELATEISSSLTRAYSAKQSFDLSKLCILDGLQCWKLYIDILILECGGNLFDAVSLAVKAALHNTRIPCVRAVVMDAGQIDLTLSDDPYDCSRLDVSNAPCMVTLCKIGDHCLVDPSLEEETCSTASVVLAVTESSQITTVFKTGVGSFHLLTLNDAIQVGKSIGSDLNRGLQAALLQEESAGETRKRFGFLVLK